MVFLNRCINILFTESSKSSSRLSLVGRQCLGLWGMSGDEGSHLGGPGSRGTRCVGVLAGTWDA